MGHGFSSYRMLTWFQQAAFTIPLAWWLTIDRSSLFICEGSEMPLQLSLFVRTFWWDDSSAFDLATEWLPSPNAANSYQSTSTGIPGSLRSDQIRSVAQSCPTLCDPMNCSTPGLPVHHQLLEFTQTHVHRVSDAIQPSHPLSSPSPPAPNPSQHQSLFQWVNSSHEAAKVLKFQL